MTEAPAVGWVDIRAGTLDAERSMLWYAPRKPGSGWSRPDEERVARLLAEGRMQPAGQAVIDAAKASGGWATTSRTVWFPRTCRRPGRPGRCPGPLGRLPAVGAPRRPRWIVQAKRPETRAKRIAETADRAARGERAHQWARR